MAAMTSRYLGPDWGHGGSGRRAYIERCHEGGGISSRMRFPPSPKFAGQWRKSLSWLFADTSACLCGHLSDPRLKGRAELEDKVRRQPGSVGWAKARFSRRAHLGRPKVGTLRFAHPTSRTS